MQIFFGPPNPERYSFEGRFSSPAGDVALRRSSIMIHGAGRFGDGSSAIILKRDADGPTALTALDGPGLNIPHRDARSDFATVAKRKALGLVRCPQNSYLPIWRQFAIGALVVLGKPSWTK